MYRLYDANENLLYIGISWSAIVRFAQHKTEKPWIDEVRAVRIEVLDVSRAEIERLEAKAIGAENPRYNVTHRGRRTCGVIERNPRRAGFDHVFLAGNKASAEAYGSLVAGLDGVWRHLEDARLADNPREATMAVVGELIEALQMPDMHNECKANGRYEVTYPIMHDGDRWAFYYCDHCKQYWRCGY